jgi:hypothetical protein
VNEYDYKKFAKWLLAHKANTDAIQLEDGFMAALRYDVQIQKNCFAHRVTLEDGTKSIANISVLRPKVASSTYTTCRKFKELQLSNNPYAESGSRVLWYPKTGLPREKKATTKQPAASTSNTTPSTAQSSSTVDKNKAKDPQGSGYQGLNYNPNYQPRQQEHEGANRGRGRKQYCR